MTHKLLHNPDKARNLTKGQWSVRYIYIIRMQPYNIQCKHSTKFQNIQYFNHKNIRFILQAGHILSTVLVYHLVALMRLSMSFSSVRRIYSHQLLSLLLVLHHLLDGSWVTDLLNFGVFALPFCLLCLCFWPLLAGTLQQQRHCLTKHKWTMATLKAVSCCTTVTKAEHITRRPKHVMAWVLSVKQHKTIPATWLFAQLLLLPCFLWIF